MKKLTGVGFIICFLLLLNCNVFAIQEEAAIEKTINGLAKALTDFPGTRDVQSILRFYSEDYFGINDGTFETFDEIRKKFTDLREEVNHGTTLLISYKVSNIKIQVAGVMAWATYDFSAKLGKGILRKEDHGKCTGIYKMKGMAWVAQHLHCSTP